MRDPNLAWYGHPVLPAGCNSWDINGDDYDGSGVNEPIWPMLFDTFIALRPLIVTEEMLEAFDNLCADYALACDVWEIAPSFIDATTISGPEWITQMIQPQRSTYVTPPLRRELTPAPDWVDLAPTGSWQLSPQAEANTTVLDEDWGVYVVPAKQDTDILPPMPSEASIVTDWSDNVSAALTDTTTLTREPNTQTMRKKP